MMVQQFTESHKYKLLEMCNTLFPEYELKQQYSSFEEWNEDKVWFQEFSRVDDFEFIKIHWFELCTNILVKIISTKYIIQTFGSDEVGFYNLHIIYLTSIFIEGKHPVEFLYTEFLKLK